MPDGPGQNQVIVTKELYDTLVKEVAELKRTIHGKVELPLSKFTNAPLSSVDTIVAGRATEEIQQYMVVVLHHQSTPTIVPAVDLYNKATLVGKLYTLGIALEYADAGEPIRVQVDGTQYVRIPIHTGDTYGSASDRMFRVGVELKPKTGGSVEVLNHSDIESPSFICLEDNIDTDGIGLVRILDQRDEYRGPFKGTIAVNGTDITVGIDRASGAAADSYDYDFNDRLTWVSGPGVQQTLLKTVAESVAISADNTYVYYKIVHIGGAITATLTANIIHPDDIPGTGWLKCEYYIVLGKARYANGKIVGWVQVHQGQIEVRDRPYSTVLFPVALTQTGGSAGDASVQCSFTYTVKTIDSVTTLLTVQSPSAPRPAKGKMVAATLGTAYLNSSCVFVLYQAFEVPFVAECP